MTWQTATEVNNYGFEIERKSGIEYREWKLICFVEGHGNSNSPKEYSFIDKPSGGSEFNYRLKQIDIDGKYEYSKEVEVMVGSPVDYSLKQNYPNPFNPSTTIQFAIPTDNKVVVKIYDMLGQEVTSLLNTKLKAGFHSINWNAINMAGGVYLYRIEAGNFSEVKKMVLLK